MNPSFTRHIPILAFFAGFIWDSLTLSSVDRPFDMTVITGYLVMASFTLLLIYLPQLRRPEKLQSFDRWIVIIFHFAVGNLLGSSLVYYSRSGSLIESFPFFALVAGIILLNEYVQRRGAQFATQIALLYFVAYVIAALYVPLLLKGIGPFVFALSGLAAAVFVMIPTIVIAYLSPGTFKEGKLLAMTLCGGIFIALNGLYLVNAIPPIPLALRDIGIYHHIERIPGGNYTLLTEEEGGGLFSLIPFQRDVIHWNEGSLFAWSAVFAPSGFRVPIYHRWQRYNEATDEWETMSRIRFAIGGGREGGFRGYTEKFSITPGLWRVVVETERGSTVGRKTFRVSAETSPVTLIIETK